MSRTYLPLGAIASALVITALATADEAPFAKWSKIEFSFRGPASRGGGEPNPFAVKLDVDFSGPSGRHHRVPGFYDGDGRGGLDGDVWKVHFSADEAGPWTYATISDNQQLDGKTGRFTVANVPADAEGLWRWGRLEAVATAENAIRYLKFRDGPYWLKAGCDDPENFLGSCKNYDTIDKRKAAVDYLAERGINSLYIMTNNIDGDDKDVWPWLGRSPREAKVSSAGNVRFDVARLEQWRALFEHMQAKGVVTYLVLEDDNAWQGYDHQRYYREMIARFGYLPGLIFNFNEEFNENYKLPQALEYMQQLYALYLPEGGVIVVDLPAGQDFAVSWWNPDQGRSGKFIRESRAPGGRQTFMPPAGGDWAARIVPLQAPSKIRSQ